MFLVPLALGSAARGQDNVDPSGTWTWDRTFGDTTLHFTLRLERKGDKIAGTYESRRTEADEPRKSQIEEAKLEKDQLSFRVTREFNDRTFTIQFRGKVSEDAIKGNAEMTTDEGPREFDWEAKRTVQWADVLGTWQFRVETQDGNVIEPKLTLTKEGDKVKGHYSSPFGEREPMEIKVENNQLSFFISGERDGNAFKITYKGKPRGQSITGTVDFDFGGQTGTIDFSGKRIPEKTEKGTP
jgi:hypothetical protein